MELKDYSTIACRVKMIQRQSRPARSRGGEEKHEVSMMIFYQNGVHSVIIFHSYQEDLQSLLAQINRMLAAHVAPSRDRARGWGKRQRG